MKKSYITPALNVVEMEIAGEILNSSTLNPNGGANSSILPGDDIFEGEFRSNNNSWGDMWK